MFLQAQPCMRSEGQMEKKGKPSPHLATEGLQIRAVTMTNALGKRIGHSV